MDDVNWQNLLLDPLRQMTAEQRIAEICRILAGGLLRAQAKGTLPPASAPFQPAKPRLRGRRRGWAGSRTV
jgi:hypothetical protein